MHPLPIKESQALLDINTAEQILQEISTDPTLVTKLESRAHWAHLTNIQTIAVYGDPRNWFVDSHTLK